MRWIASLVMAGSVLAGVWVGLRMGRVPVTNRLVRHHVAAVAALPAAAAIQVLESLPDEPTWTTAVGCEALGDPRPEVRARAAWQVERTYDRWCNLSLAEASPRMVQLAACLAQQAPRLPPDQRPWLRRMAQKLLERPLDAAMPDAAALIAHCQAILLLPDEPPADEPPAELVRPEPKAAAISKRPDASAADFPAPKNTVPAPESADDALPVSASPSAQHAAQPAPPLAEPRPLVDAAARPLMPSRTGTYDRGGAHEQAPSIAPQRR